MSYDARIAPPSYTFIRAGENRSFLVTVTATELKNETVDFQLISNETDTVYPRLQG
jgi:hypothetical protein